MSYLLEKKYITFSKYDYMVYMHILTIVILQYEYVVYSDFKVPICKFFSKYCHELTRSFKPQVSNPKE